VGERREPFLKGSLLSSAILIANVKSIFLLLRENVIPAKAGIYLTVFIFMAWIPSFAGMTEKVKMQIVLVTTIDITRLTFNQYLLLPVISPERGGRQPGLAVHLVPEVAALRVVGPGIAHGHRAGDTLAPDHQFIAFHRGLRP
jgi:hypothetical protein